MRLGNKPTVLFKHWNSPLFKKLKWLHPLVKDSGTWHLEERWLLCQQHTLRKICQNPSSQMLSSYLSLSKMSHLILGLSRGLSIHGCRMSCPRARSSTRAEQEDCPMGCQCRLVTGRAGKAAWLTRQDHSLGKCPLEGRYWKIEWDVGQGRLGLENERSVAFGKEWDENWLSHLSWQYKIKKKTQC